jgi:hypothetical protein
MPIGYTSIRAANKFEFVILPPDGFNSIGCGIPKLQASSVDNREEIHETSFAEIGP